jgi:heat-inducible transcriptional repressor
MSFNLTARQKNILFAIVMDYISTAEPVGSRTIAKKYDLGLSPATIRNDMAELEDLGLLVSTTFVSWKNPISNGI